VNVLKKRADRFGQATSSSLTKLNEQEKVLQRKRRFGTILPPSTTSKPLTDSLEEKKMKRAEKFGLVTSA